MEKVKTEGISKAEEPKKQQAISKSYLVKSFAENVRKIEILKLCSTEGLEKLKEVVQEVKTEFIKQEYGL